MPPPATLLSVRLSVNRSVNHIFRFLHICWQVTGKEWHRVINADVSRWLTLGQHWCRWVLLSFHAFVRPSNHPWAWVSVLHTKRLEEMAYNLACWCIQMAYTQLSWMLIVRRAGLLWSQQDFEWRWSVPLFRCLTALEFSFILFDLCLLITFFNFIMNYVPTVTFWIFTYHKIWILSIMFCFIWSYWIIFF